MVPNVGGAGGGGPGPPVMIDNSDNKIPKGTDKPWKEKNPSKVGGDD